MPSAKGTTSFIQPATRLLVVVNPQQPLSADPQRLNSPLTAMCCLAHCCWFMATEILGVGLWTDSERELVCLFLCICNSHGVAVVK